MKFDCRCISYNRPELGGDVGEIVVTVPEHIRAMTDGRDSICLDLCIAPLVLAMWARGIPTLNSCCGHNGKLPPRCLIVNMADAQKARDVADEMGDNADVLYWPDEGPIACMSAKSRALEGEP